MDHASPPLPFEPTPHICWIPRFIHDRNTAILEANPAFYDLLGYDPQQPPPLTLPCLAELPLVHQRPLRQPVYSQTALPHCSGRTVAVQLATIFHPDHQLFESLALPLEPTAPTHQTLTATLLNLDDQTKLLLARELHDSTSQTLAALAINLSMLDNLLAGNDEALRLLHESSTLTNHALAEIRRISYRLYPPLLAELGLAAALRNYVQNYYATTGIEIRLELLGEWLRLPRRTAEVLFRIVQERLSYLESYGDATECTIQLAADNAHSTLTILDNSDSDTSTLPADHPLRYSLAILTERAKLINAQLTIENTSRSTKIHAIIARS